MATMTIVNELLNKRFLDTAGLESTYYRLGFICALERKAGLPVGPCPLSTQHIEADEWQAGITDGNLFWARYSSKT